MVLPLRSGCLISFTPRDEYSWAITSVASVEASDITIISNLSCGYSIARVLSSKMTIAARADFYTKKDISEKLVEEYKEKLKKIRGEK